MKNTINYLSYKIMFFFGGRLAEYKYYNMDQVLERALMMVALLES